MAIRLLDSAQHQQEANDLYQRLLPLLPRDLQKTPTLEDIVKGWEINNAR